MIAVKFSLEIEQRVLENLMHYGEHTNVHVQSALLKLNGDCFYHPDNKSLFKLISDCYVRQESFGFVDILSLIPKSSNEVHATLDWIMDNYYKLHASESTFPGDVERLIILAQQRKQINLTKRMIKDVETCTHVEQSQDILISSLNEIASLSFQQSKFGIKTIEIAEAFYDGEIVTAQKIPTKCEQLNQALQGGIMPKSLIIIAAGASVGKTGFSIFLLDAIARAQYGTQSLFFSIEMEYAQIWQRHVGICGGKQFDKLDKDQLLTAVATSLEVPLTIYDTELCRQVADIDFIVNTARIKSREQRISVIVVDYLGLVKNAGNFERNDLKQSDITGKLAQLALELNCTVIALSQINRGASQRKEDDRCPWPHDAADSSGGHRSSTLWLGVDRPELYLSDPCYRNQFVVKCRKNRFGDTFELILAFNEGTFAEVPFGYFRKPYAAPKNADKAIFSPHSDDFYHG